MTLRRRAFLMPAAEYFVRTIGMTNEEAGFDIKLIAQARSCSQRRNSSRELARISGGTDDVENLQAAHSSCNISKGARV